MKNQKTVALKPRKRKDVSTLNTDKQGFTPLIFRPSDLEVPYDDSLKETAARKTDNEETILPGSPIAKIEEPKIEPEQKVTELISHVNKDFLWSLKDVKRYAGVYNKRLEEKVTPTRKVKAAFFNYILDNWETLEHNGVVRVNPKEAKEWYSHRNELIFSIDYEVPEN